MGSPDPRQRITKGIQFLIQVAVRVTTAVGDIEERRHGEGHVAVRVQNIAEDRTIGRDLVLVESDARQEFSRSLIGPPEHELVVETAAQFIDYRIRKNTRVGERERVVILVLRGKTEVREWALDEAPNAVPHLVVVNGGNFILARKIVVEP